MPRTARPALLAVAVTVLTVGTGCTTTVTGTPSAQRPAASASPSLPSPDPGQPGGAEGDAVRWVDDVCGAVLPVVRLTSSPPLLAGLADPATFVPGISTYLGDAASSAGTAITDLAAAGPSPVPGGDEYVTSLTKALDQARASFEKAKTRVDALDTSDPRSLANAIPAVLAPLEGLVALPDPTVGLRRNPKLAAAARQAPNCRQVETEFR